MAAITPSAVHLQVVNPSYWPAFPWTELADTYDALLPMTYWSIRTGDLRDGQTYTADNLDRIRASVGDSDIPIVPVGGLAEDSTTDDLEGMVVGHRRTRVARRRPVRLGDLHTRAVGRARSAPRPAAAGARAGIPTAQRAMPPATTSSPA